MQNLNHKYECVYILNSTLPEDDIKALVEKFSALISSNGVLESIDEWGKRRLAYPINDLNEGYYVLVHFECGAEFPAELERIFRITDGVMRSLVIRKEEK